MAAADEVKKKAEEEKAKKEREQGAITQEEMQSRENKVGDKIVAIARRYVGKYSYALGSSGDGDTLDCGLFTKKVFDEAGIPIGTRCADNQALFLRDNGGQLYTSDYDVPIPGDLVFYHNTYSCETEENCGITHVGICTGNGMQIDCGTSAGVSERPIETFANNSPLFGRPKELGIPLSNKTTNASAGDGSTNHTDKLASLKTQSNYKGFQITPVGLETVKITKLPKGKTYAEPIYPDLITVSDTVPQWVLDQVDKQAESRAKDAVSNAQNALNDIENAQITPEQAAAAVKKGNQKKEYKAAPPLETSSIAVKGKFGKVTLSLDDFVFAGDDNKQITSDMLESNLAAIQGDSKYDIHRAIEHLSGVDPKNKDFKAVTVGGGFGGAIKEKLPASTKAAASLSKNIANGASAGNIAKQAFDATKGGVVAGPKQAVGNAVRGAAKDAVVGALAQAAPVGSTMNAVAQMSGMDFGSVSSNGNSEDALASEGGGSGGFGGLGGALGGALGGGLGGALGGLSSSLGSMVSQNIANGIGGAIGQKIGSMAGNFVQKTVDQQINKVTNSINQGIQKINGQISQATGSIVGNILPTIDARASQGTIAGAEQMAEAAGDAGGKPEETAKEDVNRPDEHKY